MEVTPKAYSSPLQIGTSSISLRPSSTALGTYFHLSNSKPADAENSSSTDAVSTSVKSRRDSSGVRGILSSIAKVASRLQEIEKTLGGDGLTETQKTALQTEKENIAAEYDRITQGPEYQKFLQVSRSIQELLQSGADPKSIYQSLRRERGTVGEDYLSLVSTGSISNIQKLNSVFGELGSISSATILSDVSPSSRIASLVSQAESALEAPRLSAPSPVEKLKEETAITKELPQQSELQFVFAEEMALSLRGYAGKDLLNAALSGIEKDAKNISYLVLQPPKNLDEDEKKESRLVPPFETDPGLL